MLRGEAEHGATHVVAVEGVDVEAVEERRGRCHAAFFVSRRPDASVFEDRERRFAEIVAQRAEHHGHRAPAIEVVDPLAGLIDHEQRMHPHIAFGVPLRFLLAADERLQFGKQLVDHAEVERKLPADRRALRAQHQLLEFAPDALVRQIVERDRAAERGGVGINRQRESRGELQGAQDTQAVVTKRRGIDHAQASGREVVTAVKRIDDVTGERVVRDRVDREVAAPRGLGERQRRIAFDAEAFVSAADFRLAPRQGHVHVAELVDGEALADGVDAAEGLEERPQSVCRQAKDLDIEILRIATEQLVSDPTADDEGTASGLGDGARQSERGSGRRHAWSTLWVARRSNRRTRRSAKPGAITLRIASSLARRYG